MSSSNPFIAGLAQLATSVTGRITSSKVALGQARELHFSHELTPELARRVSREAWEICFTQDWRHGTALHVLLNAAIDAKGGFHEHDSGVQTELAALWVEIATQALWHAPDPGLYRDALSRLTGALELVETPAEKALLLHGLGTLHLDPFMANRDSTIETQFLAWHERGERGETWDGSRYPNVESQGFPTLQGALENAERYYRQAVELRTGRERGLSLKALAQTLYCRRRANVEGAFEELPHLSAEALALLDLEADSAIIPELAIYGGQDGAVSIPPSVQDQMLSGLVDDLVVRLGHMATADGLLNAVRLLINEQPARAEERLREVAPLFRDSRVWDRRSAYWDLSIEAFIRVHAAPATGITDKTPFDIAADESLHQAVRDNWNPVRAAAVLTQLARRSVAFNKEDAGLHLLKAARETAPLSLAHLSDALASLEARLLMNQGANLFGRKEWDSATLYYVPAMVAFANLCEPELTVTAARRVFEAVTRGGVKAARALANGLNATLEMVETVGGEPATQWLQHALRAGIRAMMLNGTATATLWHLIRLAKGRRFSTMLATSVAHRMTSADIQVPSLEQIATMRTAAAVEPEESPVVTQFSADALFTPYSREQIRLNGADLRERLTNLEHQFDIALHESLVCGCSGWPAERISTPDLPQALEQRTVVLEYFFAEVRGSDSLMLMSVTTSEGVTLLPMHLPEWQPSNVTVGGMPLVISNLEAWLACIRTSIRKPASGPVSAEAGQMLRRVAAYLMPQPLIDLLADLRTAGKDHLCIVPHGCMHYAPLHLLRTHSGVLADDWTVTYLPNLQLLAQGPGTRRYRPVPLSSFGLGFEGEGPHAIPEAKREATIIANTMHGRLFLDEHATGPALLEALQESRLVHIASHAFDKPLAPCFQGLCMAGTRDDDGSFFAHQLLGHDLRGLELVTLSACETARGRFDSGDNLHGLAAMLLLAGARSIIGALWPVRSDVAEFFFTKLYTSLAQDASRLEAFRAAQQATRATFLEYRHWAPFYFAGDWH